jgi:hypothetical protein
MLTYLPPLNDYFRILHCCNNKLLYLPTLNKTLNDLEYEGNPIYEIIENEIKIPRFHLSKFKPKINILNDFRFSYYCIKFKKQFRYWLWERIRRPKIERKYHPDYLLEHLLNEETDLDDVLDKW